MKTFTFLTICAVILAVYSPSIYGNDTDKKLSDNKPSNKTTIEKEGKKIESELKNSNDANVMHSSIVLCLTSYLI